MATFFLLVLPNVLMTFAWLVLGEKLRWNYAVSLLLIFAAVYFAFGFRPARSAA